MNETIAANLSDSDFYGGELQVIPTDTPSFIVEFS